MKLGFIGFGEVAYEISRGLLTEGLSGIIAYDPMAQDEHFGALVQDRASSARVVLKDSPAALAREADVIIAATPGGKALAAAQQAVPFLKKGTVYTDVSTSSPRTKQEIAKVVTAGGGFFADGALMGGLTLEQHKVPALISGNGSDRFIRYMSPYHMNLEKVSDEPGAAIAIKLIRSIYMKGIAMLDVEMLQAAMKLDVDPLVIKSLSATMDAKPFAEMMNFLVNASAIHAERQTHEMHDVVTMVKEMGINPTMSEATAVRMKWLADKKLKDRFQGKKPAHWQVVIKECNG